MINIRRLEERLKYLEMGRQSKISISRTVSGNSLEKEKVRRGTTNQTPAEMEKEIKRLKGVCQDLRKQLITQKKELSDQFKQSNDELVSMLKLAAKERLMLERQLSCQKLQQSQAPSRSEVSQQQQQLEKKNSELEDKLQHLVKAKERLEVEAAQNKILMERLEKTLTEVREKCTRFESELDKALDRSTELNIENCDLHRQLEEYVQFKDEKEALEAALRDAQKKNDENDCVVSTLQSRIDTMETELEYLSQAESRRVSLESEKRRMLEQLRQKEIELNEAVTARKTAETEKLATVTSLQAELDQLQTALDERQEMGQRSHKAETRHTEIDERLTKSTNNIDHQLHSTVKLGGCFTRLSYEKLDSHRNGNGSSPGNDLPPPASVRVSCDEKTRQLRVSWEQAAATNISSSHITGYAVLVDGQLVKKVNHSEANQTDICVKDIQRLPSHSQLTVRCMSTTCYSSDSHPVQLMDVFDLVNHEFLASYNSDSPASNKDTDVSEGEGHRPLISFRQPKLGAMWNNMTHSDLTDERIFDPGAYELTSNHAITEFGINDSDVPDSDLIDYEDPETGDDVTDLEDISELDDRRRQSCDDDQLPVKLLIAVFDYDPSAMSPNTDAINEELSFREGQLIQALTDKDSDGFYVGEIDGRRGLVPSNMVYEVEVDDPDVAAHLLKERLRYLEGQGQVVPNSDDDSHVARQMIALYDYNPLESSPNTDAEVELSFRKGDIVNIISDMDEDGFFEGELNGRQGLVPSNYLTDLPLPTTRSQIVYSDHNGYQYSLT